MRIKDEWVDLAIGCILVTIIAFLLWSFGTYNKSYVVITDQNVHVIDKYHESEDCTWYTDSDGSSYESCDPERFVVIFDNHQTLDLKNREPWSQVVINSLWHYHQEQGRLWTIKKEAYPL